RHGIFALVPVSSVYLLDVLKPRPTLPRRAGYSVLRALADCVQDIEQLGFGLLQHVGRNFPAHLDGRNEIADRRDVAQRGYNRIKRDQPVGVVDIHGINTRTTATATVLMTSTVTIVATSSFAVKVASAIEPSYTGFGG